MDGTMRVDYKEPLQFWLTSLTVNLWKNPLVGVRIWSLMLGFCGLFFTQLLVKRIWGNTVAIIVAFLIILSEYYFYFDSIGIQEVYIYGFGAAFLYFLYDFFSSNRWRNGVIAILLFSAMLVTKQSGMVWILFAGLIPLVVLLKDHTGLKDVWSNYKKGIKMYSLLGTGISGGWAAKELTEKGLKTLVLERGRMIKHIDDYHTSNMDPWDFKGGDTITQDARKRQPKQSRTGYVNRESSRHFFVDDLEHPYNDDENKFNWIRGYNVGGRSLTWGRHTYRLSEFDFEANLKDGIAVDWPIRYKDIAPWYDYVEQYIGVQGRYEGLPQFPDGKFLKPFELNVLENHMRESIAKNFNDGRVLSNARTAHITEGTKPGLGRVTCQYRNRCIRSFNHAMSFTCLSHYDFSSSSYFKSFLC